MNKAVKNFEKHPEYYTYSVNGPTKGELYALKFGLDNDSIVIFRIADEDVELYPNVIKVED